VNKQLLKKVSIVSSRGFTLIELMIVVAIVAILAAVAIPSYQAFIEDGRRAECKAFAMDIASRQERSWTQNNTYANAGNFVANLSMPNGDQSENSFCTATTTGGDTFTITVTMTPADNTCGPLTLTNTGVRGVVGLALPADRDAINYCWR